MSLKISFVGSGNVATHLAKAFNKSGANIHQIYSLHYSNAQELAKKVRAVAVKNLEDIDECDLLILAVKDDVIQEIAKKMSFSNTIVVHTSGSVGIDILKDCSNQYGSIYPPQTFSKNKNIIVSKVNFCVEGNDNIVLDKIKECVLTVSTHIFMVSSKQRQKLHLAAVFANNFSNYMFSLSKEICDEYAIDFELLMPLIKETVKKVETFPPIEAQTGPARRGDKKIINSHLELLNDNPKHKEIYEVLSKQIFNIYHD